jgi:hypothetical protein
LEEGRSGKKVVLAAFVEKSSISFPHFFAGTWLMFNTKMKFNPPIKNKQYRSAMQRRLNSVLKHFS